MTRGPNEVIGQRRMSLLEWSIIAIPIVNALADVTTNFFLGKAANPGVIRALILLSILGLGAVRPRTTPAILAVHVFVAYLFIRSIASSDPLHSLTDSYLKILISMMMLPLGFFYLRRWEQLRWLHVSVLIGGLIIVTQFTLATSLSLGRSVYVEDSFYIGGAKVQTTYWLALAIVASPLMLAQTRSRAERLALGGLLTSFIIFVLLVVRRGAILGMGVGFLTYIVVAKSRARAIRRLMIALGALVLSAPLYLPLLLPRLAARSLENRPIDEEGRYFETIRVLKELFTKPLHHAIFGSEIFNSTFYFGVVRQLHMDYNILLHGGGLVAILLAGFVYLAIIVQHRNVYSETRRIHPWYNEMNAVLFGMLVLSLAISLSGSITNIGYRSVLFLYIGSFLGVQEQAVRRLHFIRVALVRRSRNIVSRQVKGTGPELTNS
jgi:hypothetical protein